MTTTAPEANATNEAASNTAAAPVPKRITNAQTVCNERNEKGKLCNGHLKQLGTAGEAAEIHLRGDDVLFKCQTCGTLYMGPPLGHVRDPYKQSRFVEAELSALLQAAGGTLPVIKKDARGVFVMETPGHAPAAAKPASPPAARAASPAGSPASSPAAPPPAAAPQKAATPKAGAEPNRGLNQRYTYAGVTDTGPVPGESFEQKVARLKAVSAAAKQRADEGGGPVAPTAQSETSALAEAPSVEALPETQSSPAPASATPATPGAKPTGQADRTLMIRSTYCGVVDTGPVPGETFEQKVARLQAVSAAAKQRADGG